MHSGFGSYLLVWCGLTASLLAPTPLKAQAGTVPPFQITSIQVQGGVATLSINSATGCVYTLQGSEYSQGYWDDLISKPGNSGVLAFTSMVSSSFYYYRVVGVTAANLSLFPSGPVLGSGAASLPDAVVLSPYGLDISPVSTGSSPYSIVLSGTLPNGISATVVNNHTAAALLRLSSASSGLVTGQRSQFIVSVTDGAGTNYSRSYDLRVIAGPPEILTTQITLKSGAAANFIMAETNGTPPFNWSLISGPLPGGVTFSNSILSGTPSADASELNETGLYTNLIRITDGFTDRVTGRLRPRSSCAQVTTLVRLSYELNIVASRPDGP